MSRLALSRQPVFRLFSVLHEPLSLTFHGIVKPRDYQFSDLIEDVAAEAALEKMSGARDNFKPRLAIARHFQCSIHVQRVINETKKIGGAMNQENRDIPHRRCMIYRGDGAVVLGVFIGGRSAGAHAVRIMSRGEFLFLDAFEVIRRGARGYNASYALLSRCRGHESCHPAAGVAKNSDPSWIDVGKAFKMGNTISRILDVFEVVANGIPPAVPSASRDPTHHSRGFDGRGHQHLGGRDKPRRDFEGFEGLRYLRPGGYSHGLGPVTDNGPIGAKRLLHHG
jgi:hypothetical protein